MMAGGDGRKALPHNRLFCSKTASTPAQGLPQNHQQSLILLWCFPSADLGSQNTQTRGKQDQIQIEGSHFWALCYSPRACVIIEHVRIASNLDDRKVWGTRSLGAFCSSFCFWDITTRSKNKKSRNPEIKDNNWKSENSSKILLFGHQRISGSSFSFWNMVGLVVPWAWWMRRRRTMTAIFRG